MGLFITLEGPEGAGKTTQIQNISKLLESMQIPYILVREPGGTDIGMQIREVLLNPKNNKMTLHTEVLLYAASRAQLVEQTIIPALEDGQVVLCDRYVDSSIAYQSYGAGVDLEEVVSINRLATRGLIPDRTYLLDIPVEVSEHRLLKRGMNKDRIEQRNPGFHQRVREGYLHMATMSPDRYVLIQGNRTEEEIFSIIKLDIQGLFSQTT